jgi:uncharacterized cofD-like protein
MISEELVNVVSLGGGTGLACLLKGLKHAVLDPPVLEPPTPRPWIARLTAVVTVTDDGGSSGRLRKELSVLPPGDIRNCMVALSTDESLLSQLFQYRFDGSGHLRDHSFGNLFLTALTAVTGDFLKAIQVSSDVLAIRGRIYPSTLRDVRIEASLGDGSRIIGESAIVRLKKRIDRITLAPRNCAPVKAVLEAIRSADIITVGPGSLYTSLIPNLLVRGIARAIHRSHALKIYIGNLMTQPGETTGMTTVDHLNAIAAHAGGQLFDGIVLNNRPLSPTVLSRYANEGAQPVAVDYDRIRALGLQIYESNLLARERVIRHDPQLLARGVYQAYRSRAAENNRQGERALTGSL